MFLICKEIKLAIFLVFLKFWDASNFLFVFCEEKKTEKNIAKICQTVGEKKKGGILIKILTNKLAKKIVSLPFVERKKNILERHK